jgi:hypothetical protein
MRKRTILLVIETEAQKGRTIVELLRTNRVDLAFNHQNPYILSKMAVMPTPPSATNVFQTITAVPTPLSMKAVYI